MKHEKHVTVREAVERSGLSERTLRQLIAREQIAVIRFTGVRAVRIPESELERLMGRE